MDVTAGETAPQLDRQALRDRAVSYCLEHGIAQRVLAKRARCSETLISRLTGNPPAGEGDALKLRAYLDAHPGGPSSDEAPKPVAAVEPVVKPAPTIAEQVALDAAEAVARRRAAQSAGGVHAAALLNVRERVTAAMLEEPRDLSTMIDRRWPELLGRIFRAARREGEAPGDLILALLDQGLSAREAA